MQIPIFWRGGFVGITGGNGDRGTNYCSWLLSWWQILPVTVMMIRASDTQRMWGSSLCLFCLQRIQDCVEDLILNCPNEFLTDPQFTLSFSECILCKLLISDQIKGGNPQSSLVARLLKSSSAAARQPGSVSVPLAPILSQQTRPQLARFQSILANFIWRS